MRVGKEIIIPIKIKNLNKETIYSNNFEIIAKNNKNVNIGYKSEKNYNKWK